MLSRLRLRQAQPQPKTLKRRLQPPRPLAPGPRPPARYVPPSVFARYRPDPAGDRTAYLRGRSAADLQRYARHGIPRGLVEADLLCRGRAAADVADSGGGLPL